MPENLPELRDIHLTGDPSWFPPAYGWWIIAAAVIVLPWLFRLLRLVRQKSRKHYALKLLKNVCCGNSLRAAAGMSQLLRRVCVVRYPEAAALSGRNWIDFLNSRSSKKITPKTAGLLLNAPYMPEEEGGFDAADIAALREFCQSWIGENL